MELKEIEEEAKAYDKAIEELRGLLEGVHEEKCEIMEEDIIKIFPTLKKSEDEKTMKEILDYIIKGSESLYDVQQYGKEKFEKWIAWFKKQGEQKPADKVEPRFKAGDFVRSKYNKAVVLKIEEVCNDIYKTECGGYIRIEFQDDWELMEEKSAWSEEDEAVLDALIRRLEGEDVYISPHLATECLKSLKERVIYQQQKWSEEDKNRFINLISLVKCSKENNATKTGFIEFINKLKSLSLQNTWKPSDEQMNTLEYYMHALVCNEHKEILFGLYSDLKKLREE